MVKAFEPRWVGSELREEVGTLKGRRMYLWSR